MSSDSFTFKGDTFQLVTLKNGLKYYEMVNENKVCLILSKNGSWSTNYIPETYTNSNDNMFLRFLFHPELVKFILGIYESRPNVKEMIYFTKKEKKQMLNLIEDLIELTGKGRKLFKIAFFEIIECLVVYFQPKSEVFNVELVDFNHEEIIYPNEKHWLKLNNHQIILKNYL